MAVDVIALAGFQPADAASLRALKPDLVNAQQAAIDAFYKRVLDFPDFREMIDQTCKRENWDIEKFVAHLNEVQFRHWQRFFDGTPDEAFMAAARQIGTVHEKCLLANDLYVASSAILLEKFLAVAVDRFSQEAGQAEELKRTLAAIVHMFFIDLSMAISAYDKAAAETMYLRMSEPLLEAFEQEVTQDLKSMANTAAELNETIKSFSDLNNSNIQHCQNTVSSIGNLATSLDELGQITAHIESFVKIITDVSRKTKLLALNAAIEAGRSGEHGRGFNVVANEVKALAREAEEAAQKVAVQAAEIHSVIAEAQTNANGSEKLVQTIDNGVAQEKISIESQCTAVGEISHRLADVSERAHDLRKRFRAQS
jgi:uncharacterized coiled-coil DUF342 family protein